MLKKSKLAFFMFSLILLLVVQPALAESKTIKVKITLTNVELVENHHVGNEWLTTAYVNGKSIKRGSSTTLNLKPSESIKLKAYAEEQDKIPEDGTASATVKVSTLTKTISKSMNVTVTENRGRYSGSTAVWKFTFKIQKA